MRTAARATVAALLAIASPRAAVAQEDAPRNLRFFPEDIARDSLIEVMRGFSFALGVRCQYCHVGGDGVSFDGVVFESDDDPDKRKTRFMLRMVETLNRSMLPLMADRDEPAYEIGCKTCHRGRPKPELLTDVIRATLDQQGADSAAVAYRRLRENTGLLGMFDFGEWEMNVLAERLAREGRPRDAIAIYEINSESYPRSTSIALSLGALYEEIGDREAAIRSYETVLRLVPGHARARERLEALRGRLGPGGTR